MRGAVDAHEARIRQRLREPCAGLRRRQRVTLAGNDERRHADRRRPRAKIGCRKHVEGRFENRRGRLAAREKLMAHRVQRRAPVLAAMHLKGEKSL